jgi:hypothetical protein
MRYLLIPILLLSSSTSSASDHSISITIKPSASIVGTVSFNIHSDQSVTVLVYESVTKITETPLSIDDKTVVRVSQLSEWVFDEFTSLKD